MEYIEIKRDHLWYYNPASVEVFRRDLGRRYVYNFKDTYYISDATVCGFHHKGTFTHSKKDWDWFVEGYHVVKIPFECYNRRNNKLSRMFFL